MESANLPRQEVQKSEWTPLPEIERRVAGVLVEKAKTTPDQYPLSLNALMNGCNQKSNRDPKMEVDTDDVEDALESLRARGVVGEVHGGGRVSKYRHYLKDWLGVDGAELAVMAELLLRGSQTIGELRGRAARMAGGQLPDLAALRPVLSSLTSKGLVVPLSPEGRGQIVTHALYEPGEMQLIRGGAGTASTTAEVPVATVAAVRPATSHSNLTTAARPAAGGGEDNDVPALRNEVAELRAEVARLAKEIEDLWSNVTS